MASGSGKGGGGRRRTTKGKTKAKERCKRCKKRDKMGRTKDDPDYGIPF